MRLCKEKNALQTIVILLLITISRSMRDNKNYPEQMNLTDFGDKSLLILDDDDPLRGRLARAMEKKGFVVKEAKNVAEGLNLVKSNPQALPL